MLFSQLACRWLFTTVQILTLAGVVSLTSLITVSNAVPLTLARIEANVDWTSAGISGVGGGEGSIELTGVTGRVVQAFLYWHGIDVIANGGDGVYDNATVMVNGSPVNGVSLGDATTNCWGEGSSRAFRADVSAVVGGDGTYLITGLTANPGHSANGVSLIVIFDDGDDSNNRDVVFFEGNDSNVPDNFPGEDEGWNATLSDIEYRGGVVQAQLHVADGQSFADADLTFSSSAGTVTIPDSPFLYDGNSVDSAGTSRAIDGELWDIHNLEITPAFGSPGTRTLNMSGLVDSGDCLSLVLALLDLEPGSAPHLSGQRGRRSYMSRLMQALDLSTYHAPNQTP